MATMNISLPDPMKDWVNARTTDGRYSNASDYVRDLIRKDQERNDKIAICKDGSMKAWQAVSVLIQWMMF